MKTRLLLAVCCGGMIAHPLSAWGQVAPARAPLPNFDTRRTAAGQAGGPNLTAAQQAAEELLQQRVAGLAISRDRVLGAPRLVAVPGGFLTGPDGFGGAVSAAALNAIPGGDPHRVLKAFLNEHAGVFGHDASVLDAANLKQDYVSAHNGLRTVVWAQVFQGLPVFGAVLQSHVTKLGELVQVASQFVPDVARAAALGQPNWAQVLANPPLSAAAAIARAAEQVEARLEPAMVVAVPEADGPEGHQAFRAPQLSGHVYAQLSWFPLHSQALRLAWSVHLVSKPRGELYRLVVDAQTGQVLARHCLTAYQVPPGGPIPATYSVYTSDSPSPFSPGWPTPQSGQPPVLPRTLLTNFTSISAVASPLGWLDPAQNGLFVTRGNNVDAHLDWDDDNLADLPRPSVQGNPVFDFPLDLALTPAGYTNAAVVNLFYWNNFMHDRLYAFGFNEAAGNFQNLNFGRGGRGGDAVEADAQDGFALNDFFHVNNANFGTPPDGLPPRMQMYVFDGPKPTRDGDLDAEIMCHEYTHGLSNRLVGGGVGITELQSAGLGEGWSDFYGLSLLGEASDDPHAVYAAGGYATFMLSDLTENYYFGIRRFPYCTDLSKNPLTFKDIDPTQVDAHAGVPISPLFGSMLFYPEEVHNQGEVWCVTLWEARANLIDALGFDDGNNTILQLVTDGMKLSPPNPNFLQARDGILTADQVNNGGANRTELWLAFAKRGMGLSASSPAADTTIGVVEAFDVPDDLQIRKPTGVLDLTITPPDGSTLFGGSTQPVFVRVRDGVGVTNATVRGLINGTTPLAFNNTGKAPDIRARDSIYSALLPVPPNDTNLVLTIDASAPGKTNATVIVNYFIATVPANDNFASAIKVKPLGGAYLANNRYATLETGEPLHAGAPFEGKSLWWEYTPTNNARVLIDTAGSSFGSVIAIYTGSVLTNLTEVLSVASVPERKQAYLFFDVTNRVSYHIVVAAANTNNAGFLNLQILPGGQPDLTPPIVTIAGPPSGTVTNVNVVEVRATAYDPQPVSSGVASITFRSNPRPLDIFNPVGSAIGSATNRIALVEGRNTITATATDVAGNASTPMSITITYRRSDPPNDHFNNATWLTGVSGSNTVATARATREPGEPRHAGNDGGRSVWWNWKAPASGALLVSTEASTLDTVLGLYVGDRVDSLSAIASNDDAYDGSGFSKLRHAVRANQVYRIAADGYNGATGIVQLAYSFTPTNIFSVNLTATTGGQLTPAAGQFDVEANSTLTLLATPDANYAFGGWQGAFLSFDNPLSLAVTTNLTLAAIFRPHVYADNFESGALSTLAWTGGGNTPWQVVAAASSVSGGAAPAGLGKFVVRSGTIGNNQSSSLSLTANLRAGQGSFDYRVSSELNWDFFEFSLDGQVLGRWSGEVGWATHQFAVTAGQHTLEWRYTKDPANSLGSDAAFLDNLDIPLAIPVTGDSAAHLGIQKLPDGSLRLLVTGQTNQVYVIQAIGGFPGRWQPVYTNTAAYGQIPFIDPAGVTQPQRFYRAIAK